MSKKEAPGLDGDPERMQDVASAYHEAGHAVAMIGVGGHFADMSKGVEIGDWPACGGVRWLTFGVEHLERNRLIMALAGWRAEFLWHGLGGGKNAANDPDLEYELNQAREAIADELAGVDDVDDDHSVADDLAAFRYMLERTPDATDEELKERYLAYSEMTYAILREPEVWAAVEIIARALLEREKLNGLEVYQALGDRMGIVRAAHRAMAIENLPANVV